MQQARLLMKEEILLITHTELLRIYLGKDSTPCDKIYSGKKCHTCCVIYYPGNRLHACPKNYPGKNWDTCWGFPYPGKEFPIRR